MKLLTALLIASLAGPAWISIELPANPYDASTREAFLLVHAFHHGTPMEFPIEGTAEGLVNGARRSVKLAFTSTSRPGVYALRQQWTEDGTWTLVIRAIQGQGDAATAVVELGPGNEVVAVRVPTRRQGGWTVPAGVAMEDVERGLRARASALARN